MLESLSSSTTEEIQDQGHAMPQGPEATLSSDDVDDVATEGMEGDDEV